MKHITYIEEWEKWRSGFTFSIPVKVRFSETDAFGHLNNTNAFVYFEEARIDFLKELGLMKQWTSEESECAIVTADLQCNYVQQVYFDEKLSVFVKIEKLGRSSLDLHYLAENKRGEACLVGRGTMVQISKETGKSVPWEESIVAKFQKGFVH